MYKSMRPDVIHPKVWRELAEEPTEPLSIIAQQSWVIGKAQENWRLANVLSLYKTDQKEDPANYRPVGLTSMLGKVMKQIILSGNT
ncbi:RNA-directed DNA polymerase from mobile element jockey [Willisornis vidua]|uniref:RNA-directed DNA polymerase from mobile element jockey n=1 Tax=Willisornis vidua TaxID=1566151 RepID=A0ABQ9CRP7_9PASS|nr:RNA-directed DNA polymerase from mobile element jockey [Willisornis vidua]